MIDTSKPIEILMPNGHWVPGRFLAITSAKTVVLERGGPCGVAVSQFAPDSPGIRNKPEPKRRPLNDEELHALVGTVVTRSTPRRATATVSVVAEGVAEIWGVVYSAHDLLESSWRRLDGSGLWVEE